MQKIIKAISPQKFDDLIKSVGLWYGECAWNDNGEELFKNGTDFSGLIAFRDDVMLNLIKYGTDRKKAFLISERIRKGKGLTEEQYDELLDLGVPDWYLASCNKIEYLFPKAHCAEYARFFIYISIL